VRQESCGELELGFEDFRLLWATKYTNLNWFAIGEREMCAEQGEIAKECFGGNCERRERILLGLCLYNGGKIRVGNVWSDCCWVDLGKHCSLSQQAQQNERTINRVRMQHWKHRCWLTMRNETNQKKQRKKENSEKRE